MVYLGLDDTDTLDSPGTVQLARHLIARIASQWTTTLITRHQLLVDPRVPCTRKNGCVAMHLEPRGDGNIAALAAVVYPEIVAWCPTGSDPGCCLANTPLAAEVIDFGLACQKRFLVQGDAQRVAARCGLLLEGLGGTNDGVIGAVAAVGLASTGDDGRIVYLGRSPKDHYDVSGVVSVAELHRLGIDKVQRLDDGTSVTAGLVAIEKRLRPNRRGGLVVMYVSEASNGEVDWNAERVL